MGPEIEIKSKPQSSMDAVVTKGNGIVAEDYKFQMDKTLVDHATYGHMSQDEEVDVVNVTHSAGNKLVEGKWPEPTESSSSFDSISGVEIDPVSGDSSVSDFRDDASSAVEFHGVLRLRKKKLTPHWRTFIQPLIWRCKWVELQVQKLKLEAHMYDRQLAEYNQRKHYENLSMEGFCMKSVPFSRDSQRDRVLKRKKRTRSEDTVDVSAYMSQHSLFSYYENRKFTADGASLDNERGNRAISTEISSNDKLGMDNELLWFELRNDDASLEQILRKIGVLQGQVSLLKTRLDKVMSENAGKFSYADKMSLLAPYDASMSSASPSNNVERMAVGSSHIESQLISQCNEGDMVLPESAVSSHGEEHNINHLVIPTRDYLFAPSYGDISQAVDFIHGNASCGKMTYVHCKAGRGRSTTVVLCYLVQYKHMTPEGAYSFVRSIRPRVLLASSQWQAVQAYYHRVKKAATIIPVNNSLTEIAEFPAKLDDAAFDDGSMVVVTESDLDGYDECHDSSAMGKSTLAESKFAGRVQFASQAAIARLSCLWLRSHTGQEVSHKKLGNSVTNPQVVERVGIHAY